MEVKYDKSETTRLIEEYYKKLEGREVSVNISTTADLVGLYETLGCIITIKVQEKMNIGGVEKDVVTKLTEDEVNEKISALMNLYGFRVKSFKIDAGTTSQVEGYGVMEHTVNKSYCKGLILDIEKVNEKTLKKV